MKPLFYVPSEGYVPFADPQEARNVLGGKGAGLFEMTGYGVPVPDFIVIPTSLCVEYMADPASAKQTALMIADKAVDHFNSRGGLSLFSVRSGARVSMPGMMDTVLNVGATTVECQDYWSKLPERVRADCYRRLLHMFGATVYGVEDRLFEAAIAHHRAEAKVKTDADLSTADLNKVSADYDSILKDHDHKLPETLAEQFYDCILAVMDSWNSPRAIEYRKHHAIPNDWGTAVVIQRMVFGNMNDQSGSGVLFSRCPATGIDELSGEFLPNAQGEDVVAGIRTPLKLAQLAEQWPKIAGELVDTVSDLELKYRDMLDIEFTVEDGKLYFLQVRVGKRGARAAVRIALDMFADPDFGLTPDEVKKRIKREHVRLLSQPVVDPKFKTAPGGVGLPAAAGVVTGKASFTAEDAAARAAKGEKVILIRHETSPDDIAGMFAAVGILTATGGSTSHAAVVARGMNKTCVTGLTDLKVDSGKAVLGSTIIGPDSDVTIDGTTGNVWVGVKVPVSDPTSDKDLADLTAWVKAQLGGGLMQWFPGQPGTVYDLMQFMDTVEKTKAEEIHVMVSPALEGDPLMVITDGYSPTAILQRLMDWVKAHGDKAPKVKLYGDFGNLAKSTGIEVVPTKPGLRGMVTRPVQAQEVFEVFGDRETLEFLIAPNKLEDKFTLYRCERHELLAMFE